MTKRITGIASPDEAKINLLTLRWSWTALSVAYGQTPLTPETLVGEGWGSIFLDYDRQNPDSNLLTLAQSY